MQLVHLIEKMYIKKPCDKWTLNHRKIKRTKFVISILLLVCTVIESITCVTGADSSPQIAIEDKKSTKAKGAIISARINHRITESTHPDIETKYNRTNSGSKDAESSINLVITDQTQLRFGNSQRQLDRHSYNLGSNNSSQPSENSTKQTQTRISSLKEELGTSDSRVYPSISSRDDDDFSEELPEEDVLHQLGNYLEGASSNLNERKVVKEFTKILSKSMSGATDQVKLETLENWKRRQKERKVSKDARAKLFEDLISAAIETHPEKAKKKSRRKDWKSDNQRPSTDLIKDANVDPELAVDAESVIQHIQGLASAIDSSSPFNPISNIAGNSAALGNSDNMPAEEEDNGEGSEETNETSSESYEPKPSKKPAASSDRPIVRGFKKIKHQISQRRKQLDQIKKIFNVELALNPKDGSLVGKTTKKKEFAQSDDSSDDSEANSSVTRTSGSVKRKASRSSKMKELMEYLRDNPDILVSVMSELTTDAAPPRNSLHPSLGSASDSDSPSFYSPSSGIDRESSGSYQSNQHRSFGQNARYQQESYDDFNWSKPKRPNFSSRGSSSLENLIHDQLASQRSRNRDQDQRHSPHPPLKVKSAEALLLESLRERQLMNLARLDMVLAERQQASNRSNVYTTSINSNTNASTLSRRDSLNYRSPESNVNNRMRGSNYSTTDQPLTSYSSARNYNLQQQHPRQQTDSEVLHHFMMVNHGEMSPLGSRSTMDYGSSFGHQLDENHLLKAFTGQTNYRQLENQTSPRYGNQNFHQYNQNGQQQTATLGRFRDWRDVSHTESSSHLSNEGTNYPSNVTWVPYDLSTGSSANAVDAHKSASINNYRLAQSSSDPLINTFDDTSADSNNQRNQRHSNARVRDNDHRAADGNRQVIANDSRKQFINKEVGDLSVTRPGAQTNLAVPGQASGNALQLPATSSRGNNMKPVNNDNVANRSTGAMSPDSIAKTTERPVDDSHQLHEYDNRPKLADRFESRKDQRDTSIIGNLISDGKHAISDRDDFLNDGDSGGTSAPTNYFSAYRLSSRKARRQSNGVSSESDITPIETTREDFAASTPVTTEEQTSSVAEVNDDDMGAIWASS